MRVELQPSSRIFVAGHRGLFGAAILRRLLAEGFDEVLLADREELDLRDRASVERWFRANRPEFVFLSSGVQGGVRESARRPAELLRNVFWTYATVIDAAYRHGVRRLMHVGSSCAYPRHCRQPIREEAMLTGALEPTDEPGAVATIAALELCLSYRRQYGAEFLTILAASTYGPCDDFDLDRARLVPELIRKLHEARLRGETRVVLWGSGASRRELLHADDLADGCLFLMSRPARPGAINLGTGQDIAVRDLARLVAEKVAPRVEVEFDPTKPEGVPRRLLDITRLRELGWRHRIALPDGIAATYDWFKERVAPGLPG